MSTTVYLRHAQRLLEAALEQARQERDRAVFELARGERSLQQLLRLIAPQPPQARRVKTQKRCKPRTGN